MTDHLACRIVEREQALAPTKPSEPVAADKPRWRRGFWTFALGFVLGAMAPFASLKSR